MIAKTNAANYLVRSSLENMRSTRGQHHGHTMLEAATQGAVPTDGPGSRRTGKCTVWSTSEKDRKLEPKTFGHEMEEDNLN